MQTTLFVVFQLAHFLLFFFSGKYLVCWKLNGYSMASMDIHMDIQYINAMISTYG